MLRVCLVLGETAIPSSEVSVPPAPPPSMSKRCCCSTSWPAPGVCGALGSGHSSHCARRPVVLLVGISLVTHNAEHPFTGLLAICTSPVVRCLFMSSAHFLNQAVHFLTVVFQELFLNLG